MAIDVRTNRRGKFDRCKWYKAKYIKNQQLVADAVCEGIFYASGAKDDKMSRVNVTGNVMVDNTSLVISTNDFVEGIEADDYVEIEGKLFLVVSLEVKGYQRSEQFNRRISAETLITLRA